MTSNSGYKVQIKRLGTANVTVTPASGTIDGAANQVLTSQFSAFTCTTDGTNWFIIKGVTDDVSTDRGSEFWEHGLLKFTFTGTPTVNNPLTPVLVGSSTSFTPTISSNDIQLPAGEYVLRFYGAITRTSTAANILYQWREVGVRCSARSARLTERLPQAPMLSPSTPPTLALS